MGQTILREGAGGPGKKSIGTRNVTGYIWGEMILKFRHKGLRRLYEADSPKGVPPEHVERLRRRLTNLDAATEPDDLDLPGYRLHQLKGARKGEWSITVSGNWRVTFRFEGHDVTDVDYEDYH